MSATNLNRSPSISTAGTNQNHPTTATHSLRRAVVDNGAGGGVPAMPAGANSMLGNRRTLKSGEVSDVFRKLGIGKEGKTGSSSVSGAGGGAGKKAQSRFAVPATKDGAQGGGVAGVVLG